MPLLKQGHINDRDLFWHYPHYGNQGGEPSSIIRRGPWKLIHYWEDGRDELYNVPDDIGEVQDIASENPDQCAALRKRLDQWLAETDANLPTLNRLYDAPLAQRQMDTMRTRTLQSLEKQHADYVRSDWQPNQTWWDSQPVARD